MTALQRLKQPSPTKSVQVSNEESFPVRGLDPTGEFGIYYRHAGQLGGLIEQVVGRVREGGGVEAEDVQMVAAGLLRDAPAIMAEIVALGSGSDPTEEANWLDDVEIAGRLPFAAQVDALSKIAELTFTSDMPPGKFVSLVAGLMKSAATGLTAMAPPAT